MRTKNLVPAGVLLALFGLNACETEVDLFGEYTSTPVIYGVLDASADTQFFRINRTYIGDGNLVDMASIPDSVEYADNEVDVKVYKLDGQDTVGTFTLVPGFRTSREEGVFYGENVKVWYFTDPLLNEGEQADNYRFALDARLRGQQYTATTDLVQLTNLPGNVTSSTLIPLVNNSGFATPPSYNNIPTPSEVRRYESYIELQCTAHLADGTTQPFIVPYRTNASRLGTGGANNISLSYQPEPLYDFVMDRLNALPVEVDYIAIDSYVLRFDVANGSLDTYMLIFGSTTGGLNEVPEFSNISNGALGVFGSRNVVRVDRQISDPSVEAFSTYPDNVNDVCFCVTWPSNNVQCNPEPGGSCY